MLKVGMVVRLRNSDGFRNTYAVINEVDKRDDTCSVVIYDKNGDEYDSIAWLEEDEDFIVCPQYTIYNMPKNLDFNFIALDMVDFGCAEGFEDVSFEEHEEYLNSLLNDKAFMDSLTEDYDIEWLERFKDKIASSKEM